MRHRTNTSPRGRQRQPIACAKDSAPQLWSGLMSQSTAISGRVRRGKTLVRTQQTDRSRLAGAELIDRRVGARSSCSHPDIQKSKADADRYPSRDGHHRLVQRVTSALLLGLNATGADSKGRASVSTGLLPKHKYRAWTWQKYPTALLSMPHRTRRVGQACRRYMPTVAKLHACLVLARPR